MYLEQWAIEHSCCHSSVTQASRGMYQVYYRAGSAGIPLQKQETRTREKGQTSKRTKKKKRKGTKNMRKIEEEGQSAHLKEGDQFQAIHTICINSNILVNDITTTSLS